MSLPHLLLVDDSEAILTFERAALGAHYLCTTAKDGEEALQKVQQFVPAAILLDLSMPRMEGDEVLARLKMDDRLAPVPVIIISSESARAEACLQLGAAAFLSKPIQANDLRVLVGRVLEEAQRARRMGGMGVLPLTAGTIQFGIPLESVQQVLPQIATEPLPLGPHYLKELFTFAGAPVAVLDVPSRLGVAHSRALADRLLVVIRGQNLSLALCVDDVRDPLELDASMLVRKDQLGGTVHGPLAEALLAVMQTGQETRAIIDPLAFFSRDLLRQLANLPSVVS